MIFMLVMLLSSGGNKSPDPVAVVRGYLTATKALSAEGMLAWLADDYRLVDTNRQERAYRRHLAAPICDWERVMNTRWSYRILGVNQNQVSVILVEHNDYWRLLGLGSRTQVIVYIVESGKIKKSLVKHLVEERGTQDEAFGRFKTWLLAQLKQPEPELVTPEGRLIFDGKSAPRMRYWLRKWHQVQNRTKSMRN
jgi:hypothetical protein